MIKEIRDTTVNTKNQRQEEHTLTLFSCELATWRTPCESVGETQTGRLLPLLHLLLCRAAEAVHTGLAPLSSYLWQLTKAKTTVHNTIPSSSCKLNHSWHLMLSKLWWSYQGETQVSNHKHKSEIVFKLQITLCLKRIGKTGIRKAGLKSIGKWKLLNEVRRQEWERQNRPKQVKHVKLYSNLLRS